MNNKKNVKPEGEKIKKEDRQSGNSKSMEESLRERSRFATEHLEHLEMLYREGLNLEDEILAEEDLSEEELQKALDELEDIKPEIAGSGTTESKSVEPEADATKTVEAESVEPEAGEPKNGRTEVYEAETVEPKTGKTEAAEAELDAAKTVEPEDAETETVNAETESEEPETEKPETVSPETEESGTVRPETENRKSVEPETGETEIGETETEKTKTGSGESETGESETGESETRKSETGEAEHEGAESVEPETVESAAGTEIDEKEDGKPETGEGQPERTNPDEANPDEPYQDERQPEEMKKSGLSRRTGMIQIAVFFITLFGISIVGLCMPLRPTESQIEKRTLTEFPEFTWESFLSGDYTDQISTWYADTFPFRETLLSWYTDFKKLFGIQGDEVYIGDVIVADEIPDIPEEDETTATATDTDATETDAEETTTPEETTTEAPTETTTEEPVETTEEETEVLTTSEGSSDTNVIGEQIGSVYIYGDQAFSVYGFSLTNSDNYAKMISLAAEELAGKATVYNILVPLSYGIQLDSSVWESMGWSDEEKAIKYMYSQMSDDVKTISIYQTLLEHKSEYIYFRTDHHWTALGAYYAYQCFASVKEITANALDSYETMTFENYLGSLYSQSNESEALANNPDTIIAYVPRGTNKITITQKDGSILNWRVIYDVTTWRNDSKYSCFIGGDNPFSVIENPEITDGSSVLLVKESFGNAFAPFLVDHYQYVYIIDFRYYSGHLEEVVDTYGIQDVIFMNNLNSAGGTLQNYLKAFIEPEEETETQK